MLTQSGRSFEEIKSLMHKMTPVTQRVLGESHEYTLKMRWIYARALFEDTDATLDDLGESVETLEETARTARRAFGRSHPTVMGIENALRDSRAALSFREETPPSG